jgi:hypothetical protein
MECDPMARAAVLYVALPLLSVPVPSVVVPSLKVTVPVAAEGVTVAVKVTEVWKVDGFSDDVSVVVVLVLAATWPTHKNRRNRTINMTDIIFFFDDMTTPLYVGSANWGISLRARGLIASNLLFTLRSFQVSDGMDETSVAPWWELGVRRMSELMRST